MVDDGDAGCLSDFEILVFRSVSVDKEVLPMVLSEVVVLADSTSIVSDKSSLSVY